MKEKVEDVFNALQELELRPTPRNVSILDGVYRVLKEIYAEVDHGGAEADPEGRNED